MQKKSVLKYLLTAFAAICGAAVGYAQSCPTQYSGTTFQPKSGITDTYYKLDHVKFADPSSESMTTGCMFSSTGNLAPGSYAVSTNGAQFQMKTENASVFVYSLSDLVTTSGRNQYKISVVMTIQKKSGCSATKDGNRCKLFFQWEDGQRDEILCQDDKFTTNPKQYTYTKTFNATSSSKSLSVTSDYSSDCALVTFNSITVTGCTDQKIVSENGNKVCAGEDNTMIAKGLSATTYKWEISTDGKATWTTLPGTESTITVQVTDESYYRCTAGGTTLVSDLIRPVVCCSVAGTREEQLRVDFKSNKLSFAKKVNFSDLEDPQSRQIQSSYTWSGSSKVDENQYNIVNKSADGGYWDDSDIVDHTEGGSNKANGFLLVNCGKEAKNMFEYVIETGQLCQNTVYDFSAFIANIDPTAGHEPVNAGFLVYGMNGSAQGEVLVDTETGDLPYSGQWVEKGESFNS
ncbi:MAG: hypothetical protein II708_02595, partial [Paludibacteraceae bacterium]|nr:hypothetical protein [Paludibacteraceae bacterium]